MEQFVSIDNKSPAASVKSDTVESALAAGQLPAGQCQKKSAQAFLGDNANLVNLDNLISFPSSSPSRKSCAAFCYKLAYFAVNIAHAHTPQDQWPFYQTVLFLLVLLVCLMAIFPGEPGSPIMYSGRELLDISGTAFFTSQDFLPNHQCQSTVGNTKH